MKRCLALVICTSLVYAVLAGTMPREAQGGKKVETRVFELRTYYAHPGKMEALHARFRDHTNKLFVKHGMTLIGYWSPLDAKEADGCRVSTRVDENHSHTAEFTTRRVGDIGRVLRRADGDHDQ